ncbi:hypothetical protein E3P99_03346 [Wallemia hederae]|uniref:Protein kinase domain-containing protein n=1 Tax=Wallemia hederae TaxID=1540922 RepID=A0A4T0FKC0_9BASI|nr:hypothetical protein E3P99_03346 [Wallemia hederae]
MSSDDQQQHEHQQEQQQPQPQEQQDGQPQEDQQAVDIQDIYESKENIQPLAKGRSASTLSSIFRSDRQSRRRELDEQHQAYEDQIRSATEEDDDPFRVYSEYIKWAIEAYPSGESHESNIVPLLERTTRTFKDDERYRRDVRYLRCWILYSKYVHESRDIFRFLLANDIGTIWGLLYEEAATAEESRGFHQKAKEIYELGISRKAQPTERLKKRYDDFNVRMANAPPSASSSLPKKGILGSSTIAPAAATASTSSAPRMAIFSEDDAEPGSSGAWERFGSRDDRRKENVVEKTSMKGETIQQGKAVTPKAEKIAIFSDINEEEEGGARDADLGTSEPSEAEQLRLNPFKNFEQPPKLDIDVSSEKKKSSSSSSSGKKKEKEKSKASSSSKGEPRVAVDLNRVYCDNTEFSFMELKAKQMGLFGKKYPEPAADEWDWMPRDEPSIEEKPRKRAPSPTVNTKAALDDVMELFNQPLACDRPDSPPSDSDDSSVDAPQPLIMPTPNKAPMMMYTDEHTARVPPMIAEDDSSPPPAMYKDENAAAVSTPAVKSSSGPVRMPFGLKPAVEEQSEESVEQHSESQQPVEEEYYDDLNKQSRFPPINLMTPITERTFEVTQRVDTADRSKAVFAAAPLQATIAEENEDSMISNSNLNALQNSLAQSNALQNSMIGHTPQGAPPIAPPPAIAPPPLPTFELGDDLTQHDLTTQTGKFELPEGFTIHPGGLQPMEDVEVVDTMKFNLGSSIPAQPAQPLQAQNPYIAQLQGGTPAPPSPAIPVSPGTGKIDAPNPCVANTRTIVDSILKRSHMNVFKLNSFHTAQGNLEVLNRVEKGVKKRPASSRNKTMDEETYPLKLRKVDGDDDVYDIKAKIGQGGFGAVFVASERSKQSEKQLDFENFDGSFTSQFAAGAEEDIPVALKIEKPARVWEFYILNALHQRLDERDRRSIVKPHGLYAYKDESVLCMEYADQGTLLDVVNHAPEWFSSSSTGLDEVLVVFFSIELFRTLNAIHKGGVIHGDLKIDNCLIRLEDAGEMWTNAYNRSGEDGWANKGLKLIDFGRSIDVDAFKHPVGRKFLNDWPGDEKDCWQIKKKVPWNFEPDYFGLAAIIHCMLFGKYIETVEAGGRIKLRNNLKRYWQHEIWSSVFDFLLNPGMYKDTLPALSKMESLQANLEDWLETNCHSKGRNLRFTVKMMERRCREQAAQRKL